LINIRAPQGWAITTGSSIVTIAVIDSGVDVTHPDLVAKLLPGYDFIESDTIPQDEYGHGTHVSGIAAASSNNGMGVSGVSWGAQILPVRVLDAGGNGTYATLAAGIIWAVDHGAQILNLSLGGTSPNSTLLSAVNYAYDRGVLIIAASGNDGSGNLRYPARYPVVVSVGSTNSLNQRSGYSNYGTGLDLMAPGESIYSTNPGGGYGFRTGTSMSAPFVSGLAAILWGMPGYGSALNVETAMEKSALDLGNPGWDGEYGYGLIQMDAALLYSTNPPHPHKTPTSPSLYGSYGGSTEVPTVSPTPTNTLTLSMTPSVTQVLTATAEIVGLSTVINVSTNTPSPVAIVPASEINGQTGQDRNDLLLLAGSCFVLGGIAFIVLLVLVRRRQ
jgi:subtilisin family serine protease